MAKEKNSRSKDTQAEDKKSRRKSAPRKEALCAVLALISIAIGVILSFALFGAAGTFGSTLFTYIHGVLGIGVYGTPILFFAASYYLWREELPEFSWYEYVAFILSYCSLSALATIFVPEENIAGYLGTLITNPTESFIGTFPSIAVFIVLFVASLVLIFDAKPNFGTTKDTLSNISSGSFLSYIKEKLAALFRAEQRYMEEEESAEEENNLLETEIKDNENSLRDKLFKATEREVTLEQKKTKNDSESKLVIKDNTKNNPSSEVKIEQVKRQQISETGFNPPPISLLAKDSGKANVGDIKEKAGIIKRTLQNFGITVEMDEISIGPSVTRYALKPAQGVKLSRIVSLQNELALDLAVESIRVEAPIPGKSLVGIEIPNESKSMVGLGSMISDARFGQSAHSLLLALGKSISGKSLFANLAKMPHLLIAGTTGSGKSVTVHAIIQSLLFKNSPYDLKFIMVDPKKVELTFYNNIPHLYTPVITNAKKTIQTLNWAVNEMERRYDVLEASKEKDIKAYHDEIFFPALERARKSKENNPELPERMPYIVIIIDELADIMMTYPKELESAIVRLAQKSRAVGIHLILSTQRPEVKVITGLIKANIPSRIALKVASQIDSRTIIDMAGAEKLLGQGDMLFISPDNPKPERLQSAFVTTDEIKKVVKYLQGAYKDMIPEEIIISENGGGSTSGTLFSDTVESGGGDDDELYETAREIVVSSGKASTSYLQRRLKIGYSRAARLIDILEERGVIGKGDGAKPRQVLERGDGVGDGFGITPEEMSPSSEDI